MAKKSARQRAPHTPKTRPKRKPGPPKKAEIERVRGLIVGFKLMEISNEKIARMLGIAPPTLYNRYPMEMEFGAAMSEAEIVANLHKQLKSDDIRVVPGLLSYAAKRIKGFAPAPGHSFPGGGQVREMKFVIVNDPEEGLEEYRQEGHTIEVKGHDPSQPMIDPDPKEPGEV